MSPDSSTGRPFGDIALCLSGGGYRAATYALGTLMMLDELELLDGVQLLSTVSGGTFAGLNYAVHQSEGKTFDDFYEDFSRYLKTTNAIDKALDDLYTTPSPSGSTDLSLIRSAAKSYADCLLKTRTFEQLLKATAAGGRFRELIFNATEFHQGNGFRFRASRDATVFIGNQNFAVPKEVAAEIHLADIVAASSCFPGAFEPIRFPDDFYWQSPLAEIRAKLIAPVENPFADPPFYQNGFNSGKGICLPLPLMDGGIYDNQGITSAVLADRNNDFGLFLVTDTSPREDNILDLPDERPRSGWISLNTLFWGAIGLLVICLAAIGITGYSFFFPGAHRFDGWLITLGYLVAVAPAFLLIGLLIWIYTQFRRFETLSISGAKFRIWHFFKKMALPDAIELVKARISSVMAMTSNVFMKRIRQLQFNDLLNPASRARLVCFNLIYTLNPTKDRPWLWKLDPELKPTLEMKELSAKAELIPTTLWMNETQFDILIACGRATTCFSLLKYLWQRWQAEEAAAQKQDPPLTVPRPDTPASPHYEIYTKLKAKWLELKNFK